MYFINFFLKNLNLIKAYPFLLSTLIIILTIMAGEILNFVLFKIISKFPARENENNEVLKLIRFTGKFVTPFILLLIISPSLKIPPETTSIIKQFIGIFIIIFITWLAIKLVFLFKYFFLKKYNINAVDNLEARKIHTQFNVIEKILIVIILIISISSILMSFRPIRQFGVSLLASAGIMSIIIGIAAQKSLSSILAGIQIALTQPIRIDDVVVVEGEWGRIEEITLTYVSVKIWDQRRLILPINYFLEKPFQNWTRISADLLGTIFLYLDYTIPVDEIRKELDTILADNHLWDKKVKSVQITNLTEKSAEVRLLVSAENSSKLWDLRCLVREKMLTFLQENYPEHLPVIRVEMLDKDKT